MYHEALDASKGARSNQERFQCFRDSGPTQPVHQRRPLFLCGLPAVIAADLVIARGASDLRVHEDDLLFNLKVARVLPTLPDCLL